MRFDPGKVIRAAFKREWGKRAAKDLVCRVTHSAKGINSEGHAKETLLAKRVGEGRGGYASVFVGMLGAGEFVTLFVKVDLKQVLFGVRSDLILGNTGSGCDINGKGGGLDRWFVSKGRRPVNRGAEN